MSVDPKVLADKVVGSFQALLDNDCREAVGESNFQALDGMIRAAIAEHSQMIVDRLLQDLKQIESEMVERTPLEL